MERIQLKNFGLLMGGVFSFLTGVMVYKGRFWVTVVTVALAIAFTLAALIAPFCLKDIFHGWMRFARIMGAFNAKLILGFIYIVIFTPVRLYFLISGKDPLKRKFEPSMTSYWENRIPAESDESKYDKQY